MSKIYRINPEFLLEELENECVFHNEEYLISLGKFEFLLVQLFREPKTITEAFEIAKTIFLGADYDDFLVFVNTLISTEILIQL